MLLCLSLVEVLGWADHENKLGNQGEKERWGRLPVLKQFAAKNDSNVEEHSLRNVSVSCLLSAQGETSRRRISFWMVTANMAAVILA